MSEFELTPAEEKVMEHINAAHRGINDLGLVANKGELAHAVHTLQLFVLKSALQRQMPGWSRWFR